MREKKDHAREAAQRKLNRITPEVDKMQRNLNNDRLLYDFLRNEYDQKRMKYMRENKDLSASYREILDAYKTGRISREEMCQSILRWENEKNKQKDR